MPFPLQQSALHPISWNAPWTNEGHKGMESSKESPEEEAYPLGVMTDFRSRTGKAPRWSRIILPYCKEGKHQRCMGSCPSYKLIFWIVAIRKEKICISSIGSWVGCCCNKSNSFENINSITENWYLQINEEVQLHLVPLTDSLHPTLQLHFYGNDHGSKIISQLFLAVVKSIDFEKIC